MFAGDDDKAALAVGMILALAFASHLHTVRETLAEPIVRAANNVLYDIALRERETLLYALGVLSSLHGTRLIDHSQDQDEVLRGIRDKLRVMIAEIANHPQQAKLDELSASIARLMRRL